MQALIINRQARQRLTALAEYARENPRDLDDYLCAVEGGPCAGDIAEHTTGIDIGFRVVYSLEQIPGFGLCHRCSVSHVGPGPAQIPHPFGLQQIYSLLGIYCNLATADFVSVDPVNASAILITHLADRARADVLETEGQIPSKDQREAELRAAGFVIDADDLPQP